MEKATVIIYIDETTLRYLINFLNFYFEININDCIFLILTLYVCEKDLNISGYLSMMKIIVLISSPLNSDSTHFKTILTFNKMKMDTQLHIKLYMFFCNLFRSIFMVYLAYLTHKTNCVGQKK